MEDKQQSNDTPNIPEIFLKPFDPEAHEDKLYQMWEESGLFNPDVCIKEGYTESDAEAFSIVLPPPNVTGTLHMGHAAMLAIEDILVRFNRMQGKRTLWVPGTDSAALATQSKVEGIIYKKEKKRRDEIGREELLKRIAEFAEESKETIISQTKKMGSSLDWSRYAFTLDETRYKAVMEAFIRMFNDGLIYRGGRSVNWDPNMQTTVSDDEIQYVEQTDPFYYFKYGPFTIGTVRPETKFGDKYVVMHPTDERYMEYSHGQQIEVEWINGPITATIIKDEAADPEMGTGVMTITPWHSAVDFEIAERHGLDKEPVIDERGCLLPIAGEFEGMHIKKARALILEKMEKKGLIEKVDEDYVHSVATNERGGGMIEPQIKEQWFIDVNKEFTMGHSEIPGIKEGDKVTLKNLMQKTVEAGGTEIFPERFKRVYYNWINNLHDWCISRQIWYGHRIPVWVKKGHSENAGKAVELLKQFQNNPKVIVRFPKNGRKKTFAKGTEQMQQDGTTKVLEEDLEVDGVDLMAAVAPGNENIIKDLEELGFVQDPDTLDTWFSSGLWTMSTLGWPEVTEDFKTYHPTTVLETGYDIIFFWVARMILMTTYLTGQVPFKNVYLHGLVRDSKGIKMSKSLGNIIDPLDMIEKFGADATRLSLIVGAAPGNDMPLSEDKIRGYKKFANKVWNISRFILTNLDGYDAKTEPKLSDKDREILTTLQANLDEVASEIEKFNLYLAAEKAYHYVWHDLADVVLEESKPILNGEDADAKQARQYVLRECLINSLKMLHPFMPFVTETVWQHLPDEHKETEILMVAKWPKA